MDEEIGWLLMAFRAAGLAKSGENAGNTRTELKKKHMIRSILYLHLHRGASHSCKQMPSFDGS
jgi:hypothetical protein